MELEVGMYVRTKWGIAKYIANHITKATIYRVIDRKIVYDNVENWEDCLLDDEIIRASHNIIDLIEPGDYVNGEKVIRIDKDPFIKGQINLWTNTTTSNYWGDISLSPIIEKDIESIVTKENFESMSYKVGE